MNEKQFNAVWWVGIGFGLCFALVMLALCIVGLCWMAKHL